MEKLQADVKQIQVSEIVVSICYLVEYLNRTSLSPTTQETLFSYE
jgi:hypothetical protein